MSKQAGAMCHVPDDKGGRLHLSSLRRWRCMPGNVRLFAQVHQTVNDLRTDPGWISQLGQQQAPALERCRIMAGHKAFFAGWGGWSSSENRHCEWALKQEASSLSARAVVRETLQRPKFSPLCSHHGYGVWVCPILLEGCAIPGGERPRPLAEQRFPADRQCCYSRK